MKKERRVLKNPRRQKKARILEEKNALHVFCNLCRRSRRRLHADVRVRFAQSAVVSPYVLKRFLFFFFLPRFIVVVVVCNRFPRSLSLSSLSLSLLTKVLSLSFLNTQTEPQIHAGFAVAGAFTAEWLVQKEQSLQKEVDALVRDRQERNKDFDGFKHK